MIPEETDRPAEVRRPRLLLEAALTVGLLGFTVALIRQEGAVPADTLVWLGLLWLTWGAAAVLALRNRLGTGAAPGSTDEQELRGVRAGAVRRRRVGAVVLALIGALVVALFALQIASAPNLTLAALYATWAFWYRRKADRELEEIEARGKRD